MCVVCPCNYLTTSGSVVRAIAAGAEGHGFDLRPHHTKDVIKMVPVASLLSAQHTRTGLASLRNSLLSNLIQKHETDSIWNEWSRGTVKSFNYVEFVGKTIHEFKYPRYKIPSVSLLNLLVP